MRSSLSLFTCLIVGASGRSAHMARKLGAEWKGEYSDEDSYTAGGTSKPCTGLYCQDNPLGNPCPCPVWKPCKHDNVHDGHCMKPVNIAGDYTPCAYKTAGTWTALIAGEENLGEIDAGNCMCTAGSSDIYKNVTWGQCDMSDPKWCEKDMGITYGNACPPEPCNYWWGQWTECTVSCGGGTQQREVHVEAEARHNGKACPAAEVRKCNINVCPTLAPTNAPTNAPTPSPYAPPPTPAPVPYTPSGGGGSCGCKDMAKNKNGKWPAGYQPCKRTECEKANPHCPCNDE